MCVYVCVFCSISISWPSLAYLPNPFMCNNKWVLYAYIEHDIILKVHLKTLKSIHWKEFRMANTSFSFTQLFHVVIRDSVLFCYFLTQNSISSAQHAGRLGAKTSSSATTTKTAVEPTSKPHRLLPTAVSIFPNSQCGARRACVKDERIWKKRGSIRLRYVLATRTIHGPVEGQQKSTRTHTQSLLCIELGEPKMVEENEIDLAYTLKLKKEKKRN